MRRHHLTNDAVVCAVPGAVAKAAAPVAYGAPSNGPWARLFSEPDTAPFAWGIEYLDHGIRHRRIAASLDDAIDELCAYDGTLIQDRYLVPIYREDFPEYRRRCKARWVGFSTASERTNNGETERQEGRT